MFSAILAFLLLDRDLDLDFEFFYLRGDPFFSW